MTKSRESKKAKQEAALEHVKHLLAEAAKAFKTNPDHAHTYAGQAVKLCTRVNLRLPGELKRKICRNSACQHFLVPGANLRVRNTAHRMVFTCLDCNHISRYGYLKEQKARRKAK